MWRLRGPRGFRGTHGFLHTRRGFIGAAQALDRRAREVVGVALVFRSNSGFDRRGGWGGGRRRCGDLNGLGNRLFTRRRLMPARLCRQTRGVGRLVDYRRLFRRGLLQDGSLGDALRLDARLGNGSDGFRRFGIGFCRIRRGDRGRGRRVSGLGDDVMINDVCADDGRQHRGQNIDRELRDVFLQHQRPPRAASDAGTLRRIEGSTATDRWQLLLIPHVSIKTKRYGSSRSILRRAIPGWIAMEEKSSGSDDSRVDFQILLIGLFLSALFIVLLLIIVRFAAYSDRGAGRVRCAQSDRLDVVRHSPQLFCL